MKLRLLSVGAVGALLVVMFASVLPQAVGATATVSQSYDAKSDVVAGMLVSVDPGKKEIVPANEQNVERLLGIATADGGALIEAKNGSSGVQVVTAGIASVLVSNINGVVKAGDRLGVSQLNGIAQKVSDTDQSFGLAQSDADVASGSTETIKLSSGQTRSLQIAQVAVVVALPTTHEKQLPIAAGFAQKLADSLAGKSVSLQRVIIAGLISLTSLACVFVLLYSSTHASIMSIGRNPLAHKSIRSSLAQVMFLALGIIVVAQIVAVAILRL